MFVLFNLFAQSPNNDGYITNHTKETTQTTQDLFDVSAI